MLTYKIYNNIAKQGIEYLNKNGFKEDDKDPDALIKPAVEGLMRALKSSIKNNVKRFVMTSSVAAIARGTIKEWYDENDWSDINSKIINTYSISKTIAANRVIP